MNFIELLPVAVTGVGMAFGFGKQFNSIAVLRRDLDAIARMHHEILQGISEMNIKLARLEERFNNSSCEPNTRVRPYD